MIDDLDEIADRAAFTEHKVTRTEQSKGSSNEQKLSMPYFQNP